jgi:hypothetical protein
MKRTSIVMALMLAAGLSTGCNRAKDEVLADGTKLFGERTLWWGGTKKAERREFANGQKEFDLTWLKDGSLKINRVEAANGEKDFDLTVQPDGSENAGRIEYPDGQKQFDVTSLNGKISKIGRSEFPDGEKRVDIVFLPDGAEKIGRVEMPSGEKHFDVTQLPNGTQIVGRATKADGTEIPTFSNVQNDEQGYADVKWGAAIADLDPNAVGDSDSCFVSSGDGEENEAVAAAFGAHTRNTVVAGTVLETSLDLSGVPGKCKTVTKGDVRLISYDGKLAMAFTHLDAHNYEAIAAEMASRFTEMGGWSVSWGGGAASDGDSTNMNVRLFKRGNTNTRVFLLKRTAHMGCCDTNVSSVYLLYVPNTDYLRIREDMWNMKRDKEAQQVAEQQKREQPDLQKIQ